MNEVETEIVLAARAVSKSFPGVRALDQVNLGVRRGRLTAVLGENGAGKSTLMAILSGVFPPDAGTVVLEGREVRFTSPRDARDQGIAIIFQELSLIPDLTVAENIFLGREPRTRFGLIDFPQMNGDAAEILRRLELDVPSTTLVGALRVGQQQVVEIARAWSTQAKVLILDEPTSSLSSHEVDVLFELLLELKHRGVGLIYITHKLEELGRIADDVTVMRDGCVVGSGRLSEMDRGQLIRLMAGREGRQLYEKIALRAGAEVLRAEGICLQGLQRGRSAALVDRVDLSVRAGEVLGIFGLIGAGRTELLETLFGLHPLRSQGQVWIDGRAVSLKSPVDAIAAGLALAPEDRKYEGLVLEMSVAANASLASLDEILRIGLIDETREAAHVGPFLERFRVKASSLHQRIRQLSGGNQQKVILAKWLAARPKVLLLDEPSRGIDINAKREIYALIDELAHSGLGLIVVSSELPEILALSDRVLVMCEGRKTAEFTRVEATAETLLEAALPTSRASPGLPRR